MIRQLSPVDLPRLTSIRSMLSCDEAHTRDELGICQPTTTAMGVFLGQWVSLGLKQKQQSWICTEKKSLQGFISIRCHDESSTWEIDHLMLNRKYNSGVCCDLLQAVAGDSHNWSARRIFLRLTSDSPLTDNVQQAGFVPYLKERLYQLNTKWMTPAQGKISCLTMRPLGKDDEYHLYELYNAVFPAAVRCIEGVTYGEWREVRGSLACRQCKRQFVAENKGNIVAHVIIVGKSDIGQFEINLNPAEDIEELITYIREYLSDYSIVRCLVPEFDIKLAASLEDHGFLHVAEYVVFANLSAIRVPEQGLLTVRV